MTRVSQVAVPIEKAAIASTNVDLASARVGAIGRQAAAALGRGAAALEAREERKKKAEKALNDEMQNQIDIKGRIDSGGIRSVTDTEVDRLMFENPDPTTWAELTQRQFDAAADDLGKLQMSPEIMEIEQARLGIDLNEKLAKVTGLAVMQIAANN